VFLRYTGDEQAKDVRASHYGGRLSLQGVSIAEDCDFDKIAEMGGGYSGDDITNVCRDAAMNGLRRAIEGKDITEIKQMDGGDIHEPVRMEDFIQAFEKVRPSVGKDDLVRHEQWRDEFGST
jgi:katanin p60 ATPase-containing subunit A1